MWGHHQPDVSDHSEHGEDAPDGGVAVPLLLLQGRYNGRILGKKSEIRPNALFWSEFGGILRSLEKFGGI